MSELSNVFLVDIEKVEGQMSDPRIHSIDVLKGISIILVITAHSAYFWVSPQWYWLFGLLYMVLDVFGPSMFVFLSSLGVVFSVKSKEGLYPGDTIKSRIRRRSLTLIAIGIVHNFVLRAGTTLPWYLAWYGWSIIFTIGVFQALTYFSLKLSRMNRVILAFLVIYVGPALHDILRARFATPLPGGGWDHWPIDDLGDFTNGYSVLFYVLYSIGDWEPILPWAALPLISSIIGEMLLETMDKGSRQDYEVFQREILFIGLFLTLGGILAGLRLVTYTFGFPMYSIITGQTTLQAGYGSPVQISGIPEFLVHGSGPNMLYNLGVALLLEAVFFSLLELKEKRGKWVNTFEFYGKLSLTIFFLHQVLIGAFFFWEHKLGAETYFFALALLILLNGLIMFLWVVKGKAVGTLEWAVIVIGQFEQFIAMRRQKKKERGWRPRSR
ncbi:MAG: hypothetical protein Kow0069_31330 [Promethearchaeota archaeon]